MKRVFFIFSLIMVASNWIIAQQTATVRTPQGSLVPDTYVMSEDFSAADVGYINNRMKIEYPHATVLKPATTTYNCHAYAWHISEGGSAVWMGRYTNPTSIYWTDGSYVEIGNPIKGAKVSYANDNHSAVVTDDVDVFVSKWGAWPLVRHEKKYCPYESQGLRYFVRIKLTGPTQVCTEATFTLNNLTEGATVYWNKGGGRWNALELVSGQGTAKAKYRATGNGQGTVSATVSYNGTSTTIKHSAWAGLPIAELIVNNDGIGRASACLKHKPIDMHAVPPEWLLWNPSPQVNFVVDNDGKCGRVRNASGHWNISGNVIVTNGCGEATEQFQMSGFYRTECPRQLEQRGAGNNLTIMYNKPIDCPILPVHDLEQQTSIPVLEVYDRMGQLVLRQHGEQVKLGSLRPGLYIVRAYSDGEVATITVVRE